MGGRKHNFPSSFHTDHFSEDRYVDAQGMCWADRKGYGCLCISYRTEGPIYTMADVPILGKRPDPATREELIDRWQRMTTGKEGAAGEMTIYYKLHGVHYHARLFSKGALLGTLTFNEDEWAYFRKALVDNLWIGFREDGANE
jgi:hypothetical protein